MLEQGAVVHEDVQKENRSMKSMSFFPSRSSLCLLACGLLACPALFISGCGSTGKSNLTSIEIAQKAKTLREEALTCYQRFYASQTDADKGIDIEALTCFVDRRKSTAALFPNAIDCPSCYAQYGEALRMLGVYYRTLGLKQAEQAKNATGEKKTALETRSVANRAKSDLNFKMCLQQLNINFSTGQASPAAYWSAFEAAYLLKQYSFALEFLKGYELNNVLNSTEKTKLEKWRQRTALAQEKKLRDDVRKELENK